MGNGSSSRVQLEQYISDILFSGCSILAVIDTASMPCGCKWIVNLFFSVWISLKNYRRGPLADLVLSEETSLGNEIYIWINFSDEAKTQSDCNFLLTLKVIMLLHLHFEVYSSLNLSQKFKFPHRWVRDSKALENWAKNVLHTHWLDSIWLHWARAARHLQHFVFYVEVCSMWRYTPE